MPAASRSITTPNMRPPGSRPLSVFTRAPSSVRTSLPAVTVRLGWAYAPVPHGSAESSMAFEVMSGSKYSGMSGATR